MAASRGSVRQPGRGGLVQRGTADQRAPDTVSLPSVNDFLVWSMGSWDSVPIARARGGDLVGARDGARNWDVARAGEPDGR